MLQTQADKEKLATYVINRSWFIAFSVAFMFGIIWTIIGDNSIKLLFVSIAFLFFLRSAILTEMSAIALNEHH
ncbi:MAG TPA: hypothetical protein ENK65_02215 [Helicobacteraceae bacterium]|nr:hypothetical protein [Helicobacteraceae bacterium]